MFKIQCLELGKKSRQRSEVYTPDAGVEEGIINGFDLLFGTKTNNKTWAKSHAIGQSNVKIYSLILYALL